MGKKYDFRFDDLEDIKFQDFDFRTGDILFRCNGTLVWEIEYVPWFGYRRGKCFSILNDREYSSSCTGRFVDVSELLNDSCYMLKQKNKASNDVGYHIDCGGFNFQKLNNVQEYKKDTPYFDFKKLKEVNLKDFDFGGDKRLFQVLLHTAREIEKEDDNLIIKRVFGLRDNTLFNHIMVGESLDLDEILNSQFCVLEDKKIKDIEIGDECYLLLSCGDYSPIYFNEGYVDSLKMGNIFWTKEELIEEKQKRIEKSNKKTGGFFIGKQTN